MKTENNSMFEKIRLGLLNMDPVFWAENNLILDGKPFKINGNGYKPFADIYRYIGVKALEKDSKPLILKKSRQVGGTIMACVLELYFCASGLFGTNGRPAMRIMHCFPQLEIAYSYSKTKLNTMISGAVIKSTLKKNSGKLKSVIEEKLDKNVASNDSLSLKQFENGNHIWVESTGLDSNRLRGRTSDVIFFDEIQDIKKEAISNALKILTKSMYGNVGNGIQVYFGTPKQYGSHYHSLWNESSQQYYHLGCLKCGEHFPLYTPGSNDWEKIWLYEFTVRCTHCGFEQDKREAAEIGKWIPFDNTKETKYIGYHINQLYNPDYTKEKIISEKPENNPNNTERSYQNEVLGEFYSGSSAPITSDQIQEFCADMNRGFAERVTSSDNRKIFAGFDWGSKLDYSQLTVGEKEDKKARGQSFSCAVVIAAENSLLSVIYATPLKSDDLTYKKELVAEIFRRYNVSQACGDIGYANDLTPILQREYGDRFLATRAAGTVKGHVKYSDDVFPKEIVFEKDYYIEKAYSEMRNGRIRFPYKNFDPKIAWLINHICSMEIKISMDRSGELKQRYVKGITQNDGFMALINCLIGVEYELTRGFKNMHPDHQLTPGKKEPILALLGNIPRMK